MSRHASSRLAEIVDRFEGLPVGVVGDLVADVYLRGIPVRISREAPVLILRYEGEEHIPGGAANTANNIGALGGAVHPVGLLGDDEPGRGILRYFAARGIDTSSIVVTPDYSTITKTRVMAGAPTRHPHQVVRLDREPAGPPPLAACQRILANVRSLAPRVKGWVFSDYGYGAAPPGVAATLSGIRVADSRGRITEFAGFTAITPNEEEAAEQVGHPVLTDAQARRAGKALLEKSGVENVVITRGNRGMALFTRDGRECLLPCSGTEEVTDVTGAGDTVTGVLALALVAGATPEEAVVLANHAGGIVVAKPGAATLTRAELEARLSESV